MPGSHASKSIPSLTGLRGIAAVWVLLYHLQQNAGNLWGMNWLAGMRVLERGWAGVDLFFVLSGFILMYTHGNEFASNKNLPITRFAKLRLMRVYPLSIVVLLLIAAIVGMDPGYARWYRGLAAGNLSGEAFIRTALLATRWPIIGSGDWNEPTWSLSVEILGYALFPSIANILMYCRSFLYAVLFGLAFLALFAIIQWETGIINKNDFGYAWSFFRMICCFLSGAAFCRALSLAGDRFKRYGNILEIAAAFLVFISISTWNGAIFMPLGFSVLIFSISLQSGILSQLLTCRPIMFIGRISFPLYLIHVTPLFWLRYHIGGVVMPELQIGTILILYVIFCVVCATVLHAFIEIPSHKLGRVWAGSA